MYICCEIRAHREQDADKIADKRATEIVAKAISTRKKFLVVRNWPVGDSRLRGFSTVWAFVFESYPDSIVSEKVPILYYWRLDTVAAC